MSSEDFHKRSLHLTLRWLQGIALLRDTRPCVAWTTAVFWEPDHFLKGNPCVSPQSWWNCCEGCAFVSYMIKKALIQSSYLAMAFTGDVKHLQNEHHSAPWVSEENETPMFFKTKWFTTMQGNMQERNQNLCLCVFVSVSLSAVCVCFSVLFKKVSTLIATEDFVHNTAMFCSAYFVCRSTTKYACFTTCNDSFAQQAPRMCVSTAQMSYTKKRQVTVKLKPQHVWQWLGRNYSCAELTLGEWIPFLTDCFLRIFWWKAKMMFLKFKAKQVSGDSEV